MGDWAHATLDSSLLNGRVRREYKRSNYLDTTFERRPAKLLSDIQVRARPVVRRESEAIQAKLKPIPQKQPDQQASHQTTVDLSQAPIYRPVAYTPSVKEVHRKISTKFVSLPKSLKISLKKKNKVQLSLMSLALLLILSGIYISFLGLKSDHVAQVQAAKLTQQANKVFNNNKPGVATPSTTLATVKPSPQTLAQYTVLPNYPRYLIIPSLGVDARVLSVGVNAQGALDTPDNVFDTAWYNKSQLPGQPGAMLIDGHISSWTSHGVFYGLKNLVAGDTIEVVNGAGATFTYSVVKTVIYSAGSVDMNAAVSPVTPGVPGLNLISCAGDVIPGTSLFNDRIVVFSQLVSS